MSGPNARWNKPVEVSLPNSGFFEVKGPFEALAHLTENWPGRGLKFVRARSACRAAIAGYKSVDEARLAFEAAAVEAREQLDWRRH